MEGEPLENDPFADLIGGGENSQSPFSMDEEPDDWITTENNVHIPVNKGETHKEATENFIKQKEKENKPKDIKELLGEEIKNVKGKEAINALLQKKSGHVKDAFHRDDTGPIDLIWGDENKGLCHIIKQRTAQNIDIPSFLSDLAQVIEKGDMRISPDRGNFELLYNGKMAIVSPSLENNKITFLLTAFKTSRKRHKK